MLLRQIKQSPALVLLVITVLNTLYLGSFRKKEPFPYIEDKVCCPWDELTSPCHNLSGYFGFYKPLSPFAITNSSILRNLVFILFPQQTKKIIASLPREVRLTAFFQIDSPEKKLFQDRMQSILESSDKINLLFIDPDKNPAITKQYGITTYGTIVLESGKKESKVRDPSETNLINGILKVIKDEQKVIRFLEGHGEKRD